MEIRDFVWELHRPIAESLRALGSRGHRSGCSSACATLPREGRMIYSCGNGGSALIASQMVIAL